jgi:WD40 repeat protein
VLFSNEFSAEEPMNSPAPDTLKLVKEFPRSAITFGVARLPGTGRVFLGGSDFAVAEADISAAKFEAKELYKHESYVTSVALAGTTLLSGGYDGKLRWYDIEKKTRIRTSDAHAKWMRRIVAAPDGSRFASVADDMVCKLWDARTGQMIREFKGHELLTPQGYGSMLYAATFSADGKYLATGDKVGHVVVWDAETGKSLATVEAPTMYTWDKTARLHSIGGIRSLAFSPDGTHLAIGGMGKVGNIDHLEGKSRLEVFDWAVGKQICEIQSDKFKGLINQLHWAKDGSWLLGAGGGAEGFFHFFNVKDKKSIREEKVATFIHDICVTEGDDAIIAGGHNKILSYRLGA